MASGPPERRDLSGEQRLMVAVLQDAIRVVLQTPGRSRAPHGPGAEAWRWIESTDMRWPFSFDRICEALGLDAARLRATVLTTDVAAPSPSLILVTKLRREGHRRRRAHGPVRRVA